ncbi:MAG TPA: DUF2959 domain-containing protein [Tepidisphaeraceae bacterium]|jgi:hypothetical protein|nr:DUF2959 domain-containing protein [Tepidisphaeraceae bacterium]
MLKTPTRPSILCLLLIAGCSSTYYSIWEKLGYEKRDILVSRIKSTNDDQEAAKKQFETTLQRFKDVTNFNGGDLEAEYNKLNSSYQSCESRANDVSSRIKSVEKVAADLFDEWQSELGQYSDPKLRQESEQKLTETKARYQKLITVMKQAEARMTPVLNAFHDQVLFLKHNLNAAAIASLQTTSAGIEADVTQLIKEMNASIAEANSFVSQLK